MRRDVKKAYDLYSEFREETPKRGRHIKVKWPKSLTVMGTVKAIEYDTTMNNRTELFRHTFNAGSKPYLCADGETGQLFIIEGRYHVTERGIVDLDAQGRELDDDGRLLTD